MNRLAIAALSASILALTATVPIASPADQVNAVLEHWAAAFNANDAQAVVKLYAPDATLLGTVSPTIAYGSEAVQKYFDRLPGSTFKVNVGVHQSITLSDTAALATGFYDFSWANDGKLMLLPARFTFVVMRLGNEWLIVHHHSSRRPEQ
jgi:uncharacterized protein (TIGR02246 family)